eukprot:TRINITY_DN778205_c0_g1_i1.p1 TRINITY_DN778205_c0_g1~~TRINITY_DN778205_c0_g1_i1.p1  ORF type:complete len:399 (+),score=132.44 TRINITY_DN778205_c0_g1_i1:86-1282(+)
MSGVNNDKFAHLSYGSLKQRISPGTFATKVTAINKGLMAFASDNDLYYANVSSVRDFEYRPQAKVTGVSVPVKFDQFDVYKVNTQHTSEIQTVKSTGNLVGTVDAQGNVIIREVDPMLLSDKETEDGDKSPPTKRTPAQSWIIPSTRTVEQSWAGLSFNPENEEMCVTTHSLSKNIKVIEKDTVLRELNTIAPTTAITYSYKNKVCVAETSVVSLWDVRKKGNKATFRIDTHCDCLRAIEMRDETTVAAIGDYGSSYFIDTRNGKVIERWTSPSKYEVTGILFSQDLSRCYTCGLDNDIICNLWRDDKISKNWGASAGITSKLQLNHQLGFRGDGRWIGVDIIPNEDGKSETIFGVSEFGTIYMCEDAQKVLRVQLEAMEEARVTAEAKTESSTDEKI